MGYFLGEDFMEGLVSIKLTKLCFLANFGLTELILGVENELGLCKSIAECIQSSAVFTEWTFKCPFFL